MLCIWQLWTEQNRNSTLICSKEVYSQKEVLLTLSIQAPVFTCLQHMPFENTIGKGAIASNKQFLLFALFFFFFFFFLSFFLFENFLLFSSNLKLSFANSFSLEKSKILSVGKGLILCCTMPTFHDPRTMFLKTLWGKTEYTSNKHFFFFFS